MDRLRGQAYVHAIQGRQLKGNRVVVVVRSIEVHELRQIQLGLDIDLVVWIICDGGEQCSGRGNAAQFRYSRGYSPPANGGIFQKEFQTVGLPPSLINYADRNIDKERRRIN